MIAVVALLGGWVVGEIPLGSLYLIPMMLVGGYLTTGIFANPAIVRCALVFAWLI
jgi:hypothetical protein